MKKLLVLSVAILSLNVFAGPEDRLDDTCYQAVSDVPSFVPQVLCFESASLDLNNEKLLVSGYGSNVPSTFELTSLTRKNEDYYSFKATTLISNKWESGCGEGQVASLNVLGLSDVYGSIDAQYLDLSVDFEMTNDTCHSIPQSGSVTYKLVK